MYTVSLERIIHMDNRPIGFFDSGLGGLTCIPVLKRELPDEKVIYCGDTARTPYGSKDINTIRKFSYEISDYLVRHDVKMIVIACNTISSTCLDDLRERHPDIPVIGIIDPIAEKVAREETGDDTIGVIGTKVTINSGTYGKVINGLNEKLHLEGKACPAFVPLIEEGIIDNEIMDLTIRYYLDDFLKENGIHKLILGCTHYPFIADRITGVYGDLKLINPSEEVINRVREVLNERDMLAGPNDGVNKIMASDLSENFTNMVNMVFKDDPTKVEKFDVEI